MAALSRSAATLRFFGDDLDPEEITAAPGTLPTASERRGDVRWQKGSGPPILARRGSWRLQVADREPRDLDPQAVELLAPLTAKDLAVWRDLTERYKADVFLGLFMVEGNEGVELSPATLAALGARGLRLDMDICGPGCG